MLERGSRNKIETKKRPWYDEPHFIENLVRNHRTPSITEVKTIGENGEKITRNNVIIPPEGVDTSKDVYEVLPDGRWKYYSKEGVNKGVATPREVTPQIGKALQRRRDRAIQEGFLNTRFFPLRRLH